MTLEFHRECIIINGLPIIGTITIEVEGERDRSGGVYDGLWLLDLTCTGFEPETPLAGLLWSTAEAPCETWLAQNKDRVEKRALGKKGSALSGHKRTFYLWNSLILD